MALENEGHEVFEADAVKHGLIDAGTRRLDLVVLDLGLPDDDGVDFIRDLRGWSAIPVIVLSARSAESDKIAALLPSLMGLSDGLRIALAAAVIAPLALAMGIPFPLALTSVSQRAPSPSPDGGVRLRLGGGCRTGEAIGDEWGVTAVVLAALVLSALAVRLFH